MLKVSHFQGHSEHGINAIPLFGKADAEFEKCASSGLLPDVVKYIGSLRPSKDSQYVLVNAMGAGEWYGSNVNGDHFPEAGLIHMPDNWTGTPIIDKVVSKNWDYGFPTFYNAHPYAHHRNKDSSRAFGEVELATWNANMKRVELVVRVDHDKCMRFGGDGVWDKLRIGQYPDVSMGTKVPYDTCSICLDWDLYREAMSRASGDSPGKKILEFHRKKHASDGVGIRGLSVTRKDYCEHAKSQMNKILPDGRKVWVYNDYPRFFDISFVFIGADKTAKVMLFVHKNGTTYSAKPSAQVADELGTKEPDEGTKTASVGDELLKAAFGKLAKPKKAEINKDVVPSQFAGKAVPLLTANEPDIPTDTLDGLASLPLKDVLSTLTGMGVVLKPKEFQRITLIQIGQKGLADEFDEREQVFPKSNDEDPVELGKGNFRHSLAQLLQSLLASRSGLGPIIEKRVVVSKDEPKSKTAYAPSHQVALLSKIGSAYNGYRRSMMELVAHTQDLLVETPGQVFHKLASVEPEQVFTPLAVAYFQTAYLDEFGVSTGGVVKLSSQSPAWRGDPP